MNSRRSPGRVLWVLVVASANPATAQEAAPATDTGNGDLPVEITVTNPVQLRDLRVEINKAREAMFDVFNAVNDDDRFDVHCKMQRRWQSKIREHVCYPNFYEIATEEEAEIFLKSIGYAGVQTQGPGVATIHHNNAIFREKIQEVIEASPEFNRAARQVESLTGQYEESRRLIFDIEDDD